VEKGKVWSEEVIERARSAGLRVTSRAGSHQSLYWAAGALLDRHASSGIQQGTNEKCKMSKR
jgi:hypothetical protein